MRNIYYPASDTATSPSLPDISVRKDSSSHMFFQTTKMYVLQQTNEVVAAG